MSVSVQMDNAGKYCKSSRMPRFTAIAGIWHSLKPLFQRTGSSPRHTFQSVSETWADFGSLAPGDLVFSFPSPPLSIGSSRSSYLSARASTAYYTAIDADTASLASISSSPSSLSLSLAPDVAESVKVEYAHLPSAATRKDVTNEVEQLYTVIAFVWLALSLELMITQSLVTAKSSADLFLLPARSITLPPMVAPSRCAMRRQRKECIGTGARKSVPSPELVRLIQNTLIFMNQQPLLNDQLLQMRPSMEAYIADIYGS